MTKHVSGLRQLIPLAGNAMGPRSKHERTLLHLPEVLVAVPTAMWLSRGLGEAVYESHHL